MSTHQIFPCVEGCDPSKAPSLIIYKMLFLLIQSSYSRLGLEESYLAPVYFCLLSVFLKGRLSCSQESIHWKIKVSFSLIAVGSDPYISMKVQENGNMELECTSSGWYPEPRVQWRTANREMLPPTSESRNPDTEGLFTVTASMMIRDNSIKNMSCCIQNILLGQGKEVEISLPGQWN